VPPAFSARHVGDDASTSWPGGGGAARPATRVTVHALDLRAVESDLLDLEVRCSAGTYVRAIARDLGSDWERAPTSCLAAHALRPFGLDDSVSGEALDASAAAAIVPLSKLLTELPRSASASAGAVSSATVGTSVPSRSRVPSRDGALPRSRPRRVRRADRARRAAHFRPGPTPASRPSRRFTPTWCCSTEAARPVVRIDDPVHAAPASS